MLTLDNVYRAGYALKNVIRKTDVIYAPKLRTDAEIYLKTENLQITGSFKVRGSYYKMSRLTDEEKARGVIACSAGNHAQGVALSAQKNGIKSVICLPDGAPISKVEATKSYGAEVCLVEGVYDDAYRRALELRDEKGYTFIHPFNDEDVIAGQGTIALEVIEQLPEDMTIPQFFMGPRFTAGRDLGEVSLLDLAPTIAELMGVRRPREWEGRSLAE